MCAGGAGGLGRAATAQELRVTTADFLHHPNLVGLYAVACEFKPRQLKHEWRAEKRWGVRAPSNQWGHFPNMGCAGSLGQPGCVQGQGPAGGKRPAWPSLDGARGARRASKETPSKSVRSPCTARRSTTDSIGDAQDKGGTQPLAWLRSKFPEVLSLSNLTLPQTTEQSLGRGRRRVRFALSALPALVQDKIALFQGAGGGLAKFEKPSPFDNEVHWGVNTAVKPNPAGSRLTFGLGGSGQCREISDIALGLRRKKWRFVAGGD